MSDVYAPVMRVLVVAALVLATATLMLVTVSTARAGDTCGVSGATCESRSIDEPRH